MKSILLASASVVAFAGAAAGEVTFGGSATLGYNDTDAASTSGDDKGFYWDLGFDLFFSTKLNDDLEVGAEIGIDLADGDLGISDLDAGGLVLFIRSSTSALYFGDTATAQDTHWVSAGSMSADSFSANDGGTVIRGDVTFGPGEASVSYFITAEELEQLGVGATGTFGNFEVAFAYQEEGSCADCGGDFVANSVLGVSAGTTFAGFTVRLAYAMKTGIGAEEDTDSIGIEASYPIGPITATVYYVMESDENNAYGVNVAYESDLFAVTVNFEDTTDGDEDWSIDGSFDIDLGNFPVRALVGVSDAGEDFYVGAEIPVGDDLDILVTYAEDGDSDSGDEIGDPEYKEGMTAEISMNF